MTEIHCTWVLTLGDRTALTWELTLGDRTALYMGTDFG